MNIKQKKTISYATMSLLVLGIIFLLVWAIDQYFEVEKTRISLERIEKKHLEELKKLEAERDYNKEYIHRMLNDPEFYRMEARSKLGVAAPKEIVIRDENDK